MAIAGLKKTISRIGINPPGGINFPKRRVKPQTTTTKQTTPLWNTASVAAAKNKPAQRLTEQTTTTKPRTPTQTRPALMRSGAKKKAKPTKLKRTKAVATPRRARRAATIGSRANRYKRYL